MNNNSKNYRNCYQFLLGCLSATACFLLAAPDLPPGMEPVSKLGLVLPIDQPCSFAEA